MNRFFIFFSLFIAANINAASFEDHPPTTYRIEQLLPNLIIPFAIEPAIPDNFVAMTPNGNLDCCDWIYWGPEEVLKNYFEDPTSLKISVLRVKLSANVAQNGPNSFTGDNDPSIKLMEKNGLAKFSTFRWNNYPVQAWEAQLTKYQKRKIFMAYVGLNNRSAGWTLMFNLVYPENQDNPTPSQYALWDTLMRETNN